MRGKPLFARLSPDIDPVALIRRRQSSGPRLWSRACALPSVKRDCRGEIEWMTSVQPRCANAHSIVAVAASVANPCPQQSRTIAQPISLPGQPSGIQGPTRPSQRPLALSSTENIAKPCECQAPMTVIMARQVIARGMVPPM